MNVTQTALLNHVVEDLNETYRRFREGEGLPDTAAVRIGFFATIEEIIINSPLPDNEVQDAVIKYVSDLQIIATTEQIEEIESLLIDTIKSRPRSLL